MSFIFSIRTCRFPHDGPSFYLLPLHNNILTRLPKSQLNDRAASDPQCGILESQRRLDSDRILTPREGLVIAT